MGLDAIVRPLFAVEPVSWTPPDPARFDAIMLTSANAARLAGDGAERYRHLPVFAVGAATAAAARDAGFRDVTSGDSDVSALMQTLAACGYSHVLHLAGRDRTPMPPPVLILTTCITYASAALLPPALPDDAVALLHSPRAAARLAAIVTARDGLSLVAISPATAAAAGPGWRNVLSSATPDERAMLALAATLCKA